MKKFNEIFTGWELSEVAELKKGIDYALSIMPAHETIPEQLTKLNHFSWLLSLDLEESLNDLEKVNKEEVINAYQMGLKEGYADAEEDFEDSAEEEFEMETEHSRSEELLSYYKHVEGTPLKLRKMIVEISETMLLYFEHKSFKTARSFTIADIHEMTFNNNDNYTKHEVRLALFHIMEESLHFDVKRQSVKIPINGNMKTSDVFIFELKQKTAA